MRVNELARELGVSNKEVLKILQEQNQGVKTHSSNVNEEQIGIVKRSLGIHAASAKQPLEGQGGNEKQEKAPVLKPLHNITAKLARGAEEKREASAGAKVEQTGAAKTASDLSGKQENHGQDDQEKPTGRAQGLSAKETKPLQETSEKPGQAASPKAAGDSGRKKFVAVFRPQNSARPRQANQQRLTNQGRTQQGNAAKAQGAGGAQAASPASSQRKVFPHGLIPTRAQAAQMAGSQQKQPAAHSAGSQSRENSSGQAQLRRDGRDGRDVNGRDGRESRENRENRDNRENREARAARQGEGFQGNRVSRDGQGARIGRDSQGGRDGQRGRQDGGYQRGRDGQGARQDGGYQRGRDGQGSRQDGSYQRGRDGQRPRQDAYQGGRDGRNNRDGQGIRQGGGFQGSRDGGNRQGSRDGGFQGTRQGGYQGSRDSQGRSGGFGARGAAGRSASRDAGSSRGFDSPLQSKSANSRQTNKNIHKNDRFDKKNINDDGPRNKGGKVTRHPFIMPQKQEEKKVDDSVKVITVPDSITIKDLAEKMKMQPSVIIKKLFLQGEVVTMNSEVDYDKAETIAMDYNILCEKEEKIDVIAELLKEEEEKEEDMIARPPVVCVMGHVDHGKTSLLDAIRSTNVTAREAGGITQHIGAYTVEVNGQQITFLDTPGHEAFTAMRMRGAQSTDIAILVVAADDGVMPQTVEAISHAKAAGVEIIVAVNKIDKPSANVEKVKQELMEYDLVAEDWGGSTIFVPVSAHTKEGIPELLEMILLTAEVKELKANPNRKARGLVIEAELDKGKGPVARVLVQKGTLHVGDNVTAGPCYGKVRAMMDDKGRRVKEAGPSMPVEVLGLNDVPGAGDVILAMDNEKDARSYAETFIAEGKSRMLEDTKMKMSLDDLFDQIKAGNVKELPIVVKADVQGSVEAVRSSLLKLSNEEVVVKVIHGGVGAINESDVTLAAASNAIIIGFNVRPDATAKSIAEREKVDLRLYRVIYQAIEDVEAAMKGMLEPVYEEKVIGHAVVRQIFKASGVGTIAGMYVMDGKISRGCSCRVSREGEQIFDGPLASLKRFKDDVKEVAAGYECGMVFEKFNDLKEDDMVEAYMMVEVPRQ